MPPIGARQDESGAESHPLPLTDGWGEQGDKIPHSELALVVDVAGFEGPLDLLLHLARGQKVDLSRISVLALAQQYLHFVEIARTTRLDLAADYLVMAAWLAYLKSKLLIPHPADQDGESGEELAAMLQFRLLRLEAMREAGARLIARDRLGRDVFARGQPEAMVTERVSIFSASLYDLLTAYSRQRQRRAVTRVRIEAREVWSLAQAREILLRMLGCSPDWSALEAYLRPYIVGDKDRATAIASAFAASLELVREGALELRQDYAFAPLYLRVRDASAQSIVSGT